MRHPSAFLASLLVGAALLGCDALGIESAETVAQRREAEGRALGAACRHAGRAIEDCYTLNPRADKAAIFAGWREMNDYMREYGIEAVEPKLARAPDKGRRRAAATAGDAGPYDEGRFTE
ncbi:hypothetical protein [Caldimonas thermodepolymerans]|jgi:hypothetical protein|uniref:Uncharacterized protein n=1 Tax=Caldimonas thermodepolymerans TaxID=215580 RepID=A0AA46HWG8_9BURK|nr:hypothetical protein [Caldimonas thermodepolymerans]RDI01464.1 hypothetical protein DES46_10326 [Caldimonas thermodepolymerans]TCP08352.1 hypothetical protein EV676_103385 [Caldimonas thermodepolymerans]UZG44802.1 hypothetical protein ONZ46_02310 [Caldimonas thermodepolymerans]UZG48536.1 hypothetical protein ONS87_02665 [Caldimonas thermodepolymerans]